MPAGLLVLAGLDDQPVSIKDHGRVAYRAYFDAIAPANNKYMALLFNTSTTYHVDVNRIYVLHNNVSAVTGVILEHTLLRVSAFTTGTAVTPVALDPGDIALPSGISADHNSSSVSDVSGSTLGRFVTTAEEVVLASTDTLLSSRLALRNAIIWESGGGIKPIRLRGATAAQRGLAVKNVTSSTVGALSYIIDFTVVPA